MRIALVSDPDWRTGIKQAVDGGAELVCLPMLSFSAYIAAELDRTGYELAERSPSATYLEAVKLAAGAWLAASAYESEAEGVFYLSGRLERAGGSERLLWRQRYLDSQLGRYEAMFWAPGHAKAETLVVAGLRTGLLLGADMRSTQGWSELAAGGVQMVIGAVAEPPDLWAKTARMGAGMAAAHGVTVLIVNRCSDQHCFAGEVAAFDSDGAPLTVDEAHIVDLAVGE